MGTTLLLEKVKDTDSWTAGHWPHSEQATQCLIHHHSVEVVFHCHDGITG